MDQEYIEYIKNELKDYEEIELPYNLKKEQRIKYITLIDNKEEFKTGGYFERLGDERIVLSRGNSNWSFPTRIRDDDNNIIYESRIFVETKIDNTKNKEIIEYLDTIKAQQLVIEKLTLKYKKCYELLIQETTKNKKYIEFINELKSHRNNNLNKN